MRVLYKDENDNYAVLEVTKASYMPEISALEICGSEEDIAVMMGQKEAKKIVRQIYESGMADVSAYTCMDMYDDFEDDDDGDDDDFIERMIDLDFGDDDKNRIVFGDSK